MNLFRGVRAAKPCRGRKKERPVKDWSLLLMAAGEKGIYFTAIPNIPMLFSSAFRVALRRRGRGDVLAKRQVVW